MSLRTLGSIQQPLLGLQSRLLAPLRPDPKPFVPAQGFDPIPPTTMTDIDAILNQLHNRAEDWTHLKAPERAAILRGCISSTMQVAEEAAIAATRHKGSYGSGIGEELLAFIAIVSGLREYAEALEANGAPRPHKVFRHPLTNQWVADVFPQGINALLFGGLRGEVWIRPGAEPSQGQTYRFPQKYPAGICIVLGAGNQSPVPPLDILHALIVQNQVVCCKMNPVMEYMGPYLRRALQPLVDGGFVEFVYGGVDQGSYLCNHTLVDSVHLTGSAATYDAVVWQGRPKQGSPPYKKPVGAELGCVTPYILVPGKWSAADIEYHAETVATGLTHNAGHNCLKAEIVVTSAAWDQRDEFLAALRTKLAATPNRIAWYPGSRHKAAAFKQRFPDAEEIGEYGTVQATDGALIAAPQGEEHVDVRLLPWLLKTGLRPEEAATKDENWCGVLQEVVIPAGDDVGSYLKAAVDFANNECQGTLSCVVVAHPKTQKAHKTAFEQAIADLKYGSVCVNVPGTVGFGLTPLPWGGYPGDGNAINMGSGDTKVHNTFLFDHAEKAVVHGPWRFHPTPFWSTSHKNLEAVAKGSLNFMAHPSLSTMLPMVPSALLG